MTSAASFVPSAISAAPATPPPTAFGRSAALAPVPAVPSGRSRRLVAIDRIVLGPTEAAPRAADPILARHVNGLVAAHPDAAVRVIRAWLHDR